MFEKLLQRLLLALVAVAGAVTMPTICYNQDPTTPPPCWNPPMFPALPPTCGLPWWLPPWMGG